MSEKIYTIDVNLTKLNDGRFMAVTEFQGQTYMVTSRGTENQTLVNLKQVIKHRTGVNPYDIKIQIITGFEKEELFSDNKVDKSFHESLHKSFEESKDRTIEFLQKELELYKHLYEELLNKLTNRG